MITDPHAVQISVDGNVALFGDVIVSVSREWTPFYSQSYPAAVADYVSVSREWTPFYSLKLARLICWGFRQH